MSLREYTSTEALNLMMGSLGFKRLAAGTHVAGAGSHTDVTEFVIIKAKNGLFTYGASCVVADGDAPSSGDTILEGEQDSGRFTTIVVTSGVAYAYYR